MVVEPLLEATERWDDADAERLQGMEAAVLVFLVDGDDGDGGAGRDGSPRLIGGYGASRADE